MFNGQLQREACVARFKAALEQEARKSDQEDQISSKEACKARSEAPFELGAKDFKCAQGAEDGSFHKSMKIGKNAKSQKGRKKKVLLTDNRAPIHNTRGKFSPPLDGLLHRQRTSAILLDSDDFRISEPFGMDL